MTWSMSMKSSIWSRLCRAWLSEVGARGRVRVRVRVRVGVSSQRQGRFRVRFRLGV